VWLRTRECELYKALLDVVVCVSLVLDGRILGDDAIDRALVVEGPKSESHRCCFNAQLQHILATCARRPAEWLRRLSMLD
jgi:hypothetical protein